ncbi:Elongin-B [Camelus dromedarius]|uniref:Elongin-B n=1 Tax=Camelus dromedarius TaxID=9838 RepID=A0A5N4C8W6_CAMDR|nr:Elongin-B [Camelus dromedarius]
MEAFILTPPHETTVSTDAKEWSTAHELKHKVEGILKRLPEDQLLDDGKTLASGASPATVGLAFRTYEAFEMKPCASSPSPPLPNCRT